MTHSGCSASARTAGATNSPPGAWLTIRLALATLPFGLAVGLMAALARNSRRRWLRVPGNIFTTIFRGLPELLTLLLVYFGGQVLLSRIASLVSDGQVEVSAFVAGLVALGLVFSAYASEVFLGALRAINRGQYEAAYALGLRPPTVFRLVVLPQLVRLALPGLANLWLVLLKDTSLVSVIALNDLLRETSVAVRATKEPFLFYLVACLIYLAMSMVSSVGIARHRALVGAGHGPVMNAELFERYGLRMLDGLLVTIELVVISVTLGALLALPIALARLSRRRVLRGVSLAYVTFFRGTPLLAQLFLVYYGSGQFRGFFEQIGLWWLFRDAFFCWSNLWLAGDDGQCCAFVGEAVVKDDLIGIAIRKEDSDLKAMFNKAIAEIVADGTYETINEKYFPFSIY